MKKTYLVIAALLVALMVVACGSTGPSGGTTPQQSSGSGLPDIVRRARQNRPEGVVIGIGSSNLGSQSQAKGAAETRARAEIARALESMVTNMIRDYQAASEADPSAQLSFQEEITTTLAKSKLQGAEIVDEDYVNGVYYVVIHLDKNRAAREMNNAVQSAAKLAIPAMASFNAEERMNDALKAWSAQELQVGN